MRYLLCDDDVHLRSVLAQITADHGHDVVAEAETSLEAVELLHRMEPDVLIVDLALRFGSGRDVIGEALALQRDVIVFSAFTDGANLEEFPGVVVVAKPDFPALDAAMEAVDARRGVGRDPDTVAMTATERRAAWSADRGLPPRPIDDPATFYAALADARPGDVLLIVGVTDARPTSSEELAAVARGVLRAQDRVMSRDDQLQFLLVCGGTAAAVRVAARLERACYGRSETLRSARYVVIIEGEDPIDAFQRLRTEPETFAIG